MLKQQEGKEKESKKKNKGFILDYSLFPASINENDKKNIKKLLEFFENDLESIKTKAEKNNISVIYDPIVSVKTVENSVYYNLFINNCLTKVNLNSLNNYIKILNNQIFNIYFTKKDNKINICFAILHDQHKNAEIKRNNIELKRNMLKSNELNKLKYFSEAQKEKIHQLVNLVCNFEHILHNEIHTYYNEYCETILAEKEDTISFCEIKFANLTKIYLNHLEQINNLMNKYLKNIKIEIFQKQLCLTISIYNDSKKLFEQHEQREKESFSLLERRVFHKRKRNEKEEQEEGAQVEKEEKNITKKLKN